LGEGQVFILLLILMQIAFMIFAGIEKHIEIKKFKKKKSNMLIKRKWLECAYECEVK